VAAKEVASDKIICAEGQSLEALHILASGSVKAHSPAGDIILKKGDVVGLCDIAYDSHSFTYTTLETSSFISFPFKDKNAIGNIVKVNPEVGKMMFTSMINQLVLLIEAGLKSKVHCEELFKLITSFYDEYVDTCGHNNIISRSLPGIDELAEYVAEEEIPETSLAYYQCMKDFPQELKLSLAARIPYLTGFLIRASEDIHSTFGACTAMTDYQIDAYRLLVQESKLDLFDLYTSLLYRLKQDSPDAEAIKKKIEFMAQMAVKSGVISSSMVESRVEEYREKIANIAPSTSSSGDGATASNADIANAVDIILDYADMDPEFANNFKSRLNKYKKLPDKGSSDDTARKLRLDLTKDFYTIYKEAFQLSVKDFSVPPILKMFFNFGFMDAELAGYDNANFLYGIANDFRGNEDLGVFTAYEWLSAVYEMRKEPSRNEFDTDYFDHLRELRVQGKIDTERERKLTKDPGERVLFELSNMFPLVNKVTFGRLTTFCPILSESDIIKPLQSCIVGVDTVTAALKKLEAIDYSAFYRDVVYTNDACGISKEYVAQRITPDVILFPNVGTRGVMWQEIEGKKRNTPARFMVSVFHMEDIVTTLTRLTGEYRWEMCKRIQGARWNDVSERSLTSEYFDYVQFYRKNSELSSDAKEKIKNALTKAKNSFKEMFVRDYITWVLFEGAGSPRLNKIARAILLTYCPFPYELRTRISANPMFKELIERYNIKTDQKLHHLDNVITKIKSSGQDVPTEIINQRKYLKGETNY